jgi:hypothetical protein
LNIAKSSVERNVTPGNKVISKDISAFSNGIYLLSFEGAGKKENTPLI